VGRAHVQLVAPADHALIQQGAGTRPGEHRELLGQIRNLLRVSGEFLAQPNRCRVHQMRPTDLDDVPKFLRFCFERGM